MKSSAAATLALALAPLPAMAGPFTREDFEQLVPADKKLAADWVKSLFARGRPAVLRGAELKYVGMPVGGIGAGQLYLGGDGRLWHWDIFNQFVKTGAEHYAKPVSPTAPLAQKFFLTLGGKVVPLDQTGFSNVSFRGEYPIGSVEYADADVPVTVKLEAFSPFIPLATDDSSLPATVLQFTVRNASAGPVEVTLAGELENAVCLQHRWMKARLRHRIIREPGLTTLLGSAERLDPEVTPARPDVVFEDWSQESYVGWQVTGTAFGRGPILKSAVPAYQGDVGGDTPRVVNSHATAPGKTVNEKDAATGRLVSREFTVARDYISVWIGGGRARPDCRVGVALLVAGKTVATLAGQNNNKMALQSFDVRAYVGKTARLEIFDEATDDWGNLGVGKIVFTDRVAEAETEPLENAPDYGTLALALLGEPADEAGPEATVPFPEKLSGKLGRKLKLAPGAAAEVTFVLAWHFPNLTLEKLGPAGRHYTTRFPSAQEVAAYVGKNFSRLAAATKLWRDTWYDSTLPFWFLDRTMLNTSILATATSFRLANGRYYGWEGVGCCEGTCGHVYHYAHAAARLFPELERDARERVDFGLALQADGAIRFRGELNRIPAVDGQAGTILRALREHQMSADDAFLKRNWPQIKRATQWLIAKDGDGDGLIKGNQHNTLDTDWFGPVAWLSGLYLASLAAAAEMAAAMGDKDFADACRKIFSAGQKNLVTQLFDGGYFINRVDPKRLDAINSGTGCHIDQVFGQSWAFQVGLPRVLPEKETLSALKSLWRYNFSPDVGPYRKANKPGRWYAMAGEAGLLMCSFPRTDWDFKRAGGNTGGDGFVGYFNECMNGFEYQVAGHMIWEGMVMEGLAVTRAVHDRYHASRRNPWNEVECGDHYARSMASYGVYLAACGFEYHGPQAHLGFAPRLTPENFKCAFTGAAGWGSYTQKIEGGKLTAEISVCWGSLKLKTISLAHESARTARVSNGEEVTSARVHRDGKKAIVTLENPVTLQAGEKLTIQLT